jgi:hypothetical protein
VHPGGSLLAVNIIDFLANHTKGTFFQSFVFTFLDFIIIIILIINFTVATFVVLFTSSQRVSLESHTTTKNYLILELLDNVKSKFSFWKYDCSDWQFIDSEPGIVRC